MGQTAIYGYNVHTIFINLKANGIVKIKRYYAWDGPSGPTIDTHTFIRPSLLHDAKYQLIRLGLIPTYFKEIADIELYNDCIKDGMNKIAANWVYQGVKIFAGFAIKPSETDCKLFYAPRLVHQTL